ncbi:DALR anticodon-binding domain-containing protein 3 [Malaya genurostris]|uniref:DALR anticodon-binding domain-containing protein 3 n=1 Tax=Malaya genurostris TaxID=325434 RepID=UPI0026F3C009|nr:DALR anticodon-binding domain-containing protein 3 [Malaya genurostris]
MEVLRNLQQQLAKFLQHNLNLNRFVLRYQNKQLAESGDILIKQNEFQNFNEEELATLVSVSKEWEISVKTAQLTSTASISLFLSRDRVYRAFIQKCTESGFAGTARDKQILLICDIDENQNNLSMVDFRILSVKNVASNLLRFDGYKVSKEFNDGVQTMSITRNRSKQSTDSYEILCGSVATCGITADEYIRKRANDMQLIAQHKYGIRVKDHRRFQNTIISLGRSAAIVDMLEAKASSPIDIRKNNNQSSKGAQFVLYNYARLSVLFKTFEEKQKTNYYPQLPLIIDIDFKLLKEEDEWQLFWVYVAGFPTMINQALGDGQLSRLAPHVVLSFTSSLVICLSKYYRRIRILTENRQHLLPTMFARIYLLQTVYNVLSTLLQLLNLEPVTEM